MSRIEPTGGKTRGTLTPAEEREQHRIAVERSLADRKKSDADALIEHQATAQQRDYTRRK